MKKPLISVSLLSADGAQFGATLQALEAAGSDWIHLDVMDGCFVPQITLGAKIIRDLRSWTRLPFDVHLMVQDPELAPYLDAGADLLTFHPQATSDPEGLLRKIKERGGRAGLALSPGDSYAQWPCAWWNLLDMITVMAVPPGAGGQAFLPETPSVVKSLRQDHPEILISVDGGMNEKTACLVPQADTLVSGSFILSSPEPVPSALRIPHFKKKIEALKTSFCAA